MDTANSEATVSPPWSVQGPCTPGATADCRYCRDSHHHRRHFTRRNIYGRNDSARSETDGGIAGTNTAQLPEVAQQNSKISYFANETGNAILSGCINAQAGAIERAVADHQQHYDNVKCLLSGGAARYIAPNLSIPHRIIDNLVLIGLHRSSIQ